MICGKSIAHLQALPTHNFSAARIYFNANLHISQCQRMRRGTINLRLFAPMRPKDVCPCVGVYLCVCVCVPRAGGIVLGCQPFWRSILRFARHICRPNCAVCRKTKEQSTEMQTARGRARARKSCHYASNPTKAGPFVAPSFDNCPSDLLRSNNK